MLMSPAPYYCGWLLGERGHCGIGWRIPDDGGSPPEGCEAARARERESIVNAASRINNQH